MPPTVEPFSFAKSLHRGQRYNVMCTVTRGDLPVSIRWFKDGAPLAEAAGEQQAEQQGAEAPPRPLAQAAAQGSPPGLLVKQLDPYSSTLTFGSLRAHHRGLYSCEAQNEAGRASQSSALAIHGEHLWCCCVQLD